NEGHDPAKFFRERYGFNTFVLIYRRGMRGNHFPAQIQDLQMAMRYVADHARQFGIDTTKIGICGFSAGGHLVGTEAEYFDTDFTGGLVRHIPPKPMFAIMMYPVVSMQDNIGHKKSRRNLLGAHYTQQRRDSMSLERHVRRDMPPIYLIACKDDPIVDYRNAVRMSDALDSLNVPSSYQLYEVGGHGFGVNPSLIKASNTDAATWHEDFMLWFRKRF
ncbi:MAG: alpha/beta hydrolase, partial [Bacteroidales bacterium]|nr:alpha/beta hydrolase [Bacteroidales bacterium]